MPQSRSFYYRAVRCLGRTCPGILAAVASLLFLYPEAGLGQANQAVAQAATGSPQGSVTGVVTDADGAKVANATVLLRNLKNGVMQEAKSSLLGEYMFPAVPAGSYAVTVKASGFITADSEPFKVVENSRQRVDVPLAVQGATQTIEVSATGSTAMQTDSSDIRQTFENTEIQVLPLNSREYTDIALLNPGVTYSQLTEDPIESRRGSFHLNGMRSSVNNFMLDGLDNNSYQNSNLGYNNQVLTPSPDAVQEMTIVTTNYPAEYGRSGGSIVNTVSRSGTDHIRYSLWEYFRNSAMAAYGPLLETGHKPQIIQNQFGGTLGGPILHDKLFFFLNEESYRIVNKTYYIYTIPSMQQRAGVFFDQTGLPIVIGNPYTHQQYTNGVIPSTEITPFAAAVFAALPAPTNSSAYYNYVSLGRGQNTRDLGELRLDWAANTRAHFFVRYSQQMNHILPAAALGGAAGGYGDGHIYSVTNQFASGMTYTVTPRQLLDLRLGVSRVDSGRFPYNHGQTSFYTTLDIPYPIAPAAGTVSLNSQEITDVSPLGAEPAVSIYQDPFTVDPRISYRIERAHHLIGLGYELLVLKTPTAWQSPVYGEDIYNQHFSRQQSPPATSTLVGDQEYYIADFLFGARSQYELSNYSRLTQNQRFHSLYAEDTWKLAPKLTLNYGLRYEYTVPDFESQNHLANYDPTTNSLRLAHGGSYASRSLVNSQKDNLAPRIGFAYQPLTHFVVRGAYGISYVQFNRTSDVSLEYNGPFSITSIIQQLSPENNVCPANSQSFACFRPTMQGYPSNMISALPFNTSTSESYYAPPNAKTGYVQSYYFGLQHQINSHSLLEAAYVGAHGAHIRVIADFNQAPPVSIANEGTLKERRPLPGFADIWSGLPIGFLKYNALQAKYQLRWKKLFIINSFTYSQARDNASGDMETGNGDTAIVNFDNIAGDAGISGYNQPLNNSTGVTWTLPKTRFHERILRNALNGWRLNVIDHATSGLPLNLYWAPSTSALTTNVGYHYRPDVCSAGSVTSTTTSTSTTSIPNTPCGTGSQVKTQSILNPKSQWLRLGGGQYVGNVFNSNLVFAPPDSAPYGNSPRNSIRFVPIWNLDTGVAKDFHLSDTGILQFRAEAFNTPNKTNWNSPDMDSSSGIFGYISGAAASRQFQFSLRYSH
jgi:hypothetical protein